MRSDFSLNKVVVQRYSNPKKPSPILSAVLQFPPIIISLVSSVGKKGRRMLVGL